MSASESSPSRPVGPEVVHRTENRSRPVAEAAQRPIPCTPSESCKGHFEECNHVTGYIACNACIAHRAKDGPRFCWTPTEPPAMLPATCDCAPDDHVPDCSTLLEAVTLRYCVLSWCPVQAVQESRYCAVHAVTWGLPVLTSSRACCASHRPVSCCDPEDCGPCCPNCPSCPSHASAEQATDREGTRAAEVIHTEAPTENEQVEP